MTATCPKCLAILNPFSVSSGFTCPVCHAKLKSRIRGLEAGALIIWQILSSLLYLLLGVITGDLFARSAFSFEALHTVLSLCIGFVVYVLLVGMFARVELDRQDSHE